MNGNNCSTISPNNCSTIQLLEPDGTVIGQAVDPALNEHGAVVLSAGQTIVNVQFTTPKANAGYSFEYLYVDAFGEINPGVINPVVITQTLVAFTVDLAGAPDVDGYILRWHVVVYDLTSIGTEIDAPELLYLQLPQANLFNVFFHNPRSGTTYGFTELRIENLVDDPSTQTPVLVQVVAKFTDHFTIALSPTPPDTNYFLAVRTP